jgi:hypothetical protein
MLWRLLAVLPLLMRLRLFWKNEQLLLLQEHKEILRICQPKTQLSQPLLLLLLLLLKTLQILLSQQKQEQRVLKRSA